MEIKFAHDEIRSRNKGRILYMSDVFATLFLLALAGIEYLVVGLPGLGTALAIIFLWLVFSLLSSRFPNTYRICCIYNLLAAAVFYWGMSYMSFSSEWLPRLLTIVGAALIGTFTFTSLFGFSAEMDNPILPCIFISGYVFLMFGALLVVFGMADRINNPFATVPLGIFLLCVVFYQSPVAKVKKKEKESAKNSVPSLKKTVAASAAAIPPIAPLGRSYKR